MGYAANQETLQKHSTRPVIRMQGQLILE